MKAQQKLKKQDGLSSPTPEQALEFLESFRQMLEKKEDKTVAISLRIPQSLLRSLKAKAEVEGKKYQSLIVQILKEKLAK